MGTITKIILNGIEYEIGGNSSGLTEDVKATLLTCFRHTAFLDEGDDYYQDLYDALYPPTPPATLTGITCVYTQSGTVYDTDTLDSLKSDLVVTAHYDNGTTQTVTTYTLSGELVTGTSVITVAYGGKTTSFNVTVTHKTYYPKTIYPSTEPGVANGSIGAKAYPYNTNSNTNRLHFVNDEWLGYPIELGKSYTIDAVLAEGVSKTLQLGIFTVNETGKSIIEQQGTLSSSNLSDSGWESLPYTFTASQVTSVDPALIWINSHFTDNTTINASDIASITITENQ